MLYLKNQSTLLKIFCYIPVKSYQIDDLELILATPAENATLNSNHLTSQKGIESWGNDASEVCRRKLRYFEGTLNF